MIKVEHLYVKYDQEDVLQDISLSINPGEVTVLVGPNGCGKSTLLKSLIALVDHRQGSIEIDGDNLIQLKPADIAKRIAYLPQGKQVPDISVSRMVLHGRFAYLNYPRRYRQEDYQMAKKAMEWVGIEDLADKNLAQLSGGTQQKVYIAMALAQDTPTILFDEPTTYLDIVHQIKLMDIAKRLASEGKAVVMVLHDLAQAFRYADRIIVISNGKVVRQGTAEEIYQSKVIDETFHISFYRVQTEHGWQYYYE